MLSPLLPDDDLAPIAAGGASPPPAGAVSGEDTQLLRGLLEDGALLGRSSSGLGSFGIRDLDEPDTIRALPLNETHLDDILRVSQQMKIKRIAGLSRIA